MRVVELKQTTFFYDSNILPAMGEIFIRVANIYLLLLRRNENARTRFSINYAACDKVIERR